MGNHVFICYAHEDWEFVQVIATKLKEAKVPIWLDRWDIPHGANWNRTRDNALYDAAQCLVVLSSAAVDSEQVEAEWVTALEEKKHVVPILHQVCRIPSRLRLLQRFDFTNSNVEEEKTLATLIQVLGGQPQFRHSRAGGNPEGEQGAVNLNSKVKTKRDESATIIAPPPTPAPLSEITNSIGMKLILIPAGEFFMGSENGAADEKPVRKVIIPRPFYLGKYPVTQKQWQTVMGDNPSYFKGDANRPVEKVSWDDTQEFLRKLRVREEGKMYRLPTEAEWEYACRAGSTGAYCFGDDGAKLKEYAWYDENSAKTTHGVGQLKPNVWGLYDMHGNVWEWVQDWYAEDYYKQRPNPDRDPQGPDTGAVRVLRGGAFFSDQWYARCAYRDRNDPNNADDHYGVRVVVLPS